MMINYDDMTDEELKNLYNELGGVLNDRAKANRLKAMNKAKELVTELNKMMEEYDFALEVEDWNDCCSIKTGGILGLL